MFRIAVLTVFALAAGSVSATAQSWGFGEPVYVDPPPVYYERPGVVVPGRPMLYEAPDSDVYYDEEPRILVAPPERRVLHMEAPEIVMDRLDADGYRELSPMARRGSLYKLTAVDPSGDLVALEISIFTGEIERETVLRVARSPARTQPRPQSRPPVVAAPRPAPVAPAPRPTVAAAPPPAAAVGTARPQGGGPSSTLRDRLRTPPAGAPSAGAQADSGDDPLVIY